MVAKNRQEWEDWFRHLFSKLSAMDAKTWSVITEYDGVEASDLGYSVVYFDQYLQVAGITKRFNAVSTIVWKKTAEGWKEARYHGTLIGVENVD